MNKTQIRSNRTWKWVSAVLLICLIAYIAFYPPTKHAAGSAGTVEPVAKVNGVSINSEQLYQAMLASGGQQTLDSMISEELINQEGQKAGITVTDEDVDKEVANVKGSYGSDAEFQQALTSYGMTIDDLKKSMKSQVLLKKILTPQITITDDEIKKYYDENLETLKVPEQVQASHISVATKEEADAIVADLKNGADFATIAKSKSLDTATKDNGGSLGYISSGNMDEAFDTAAFALKVGETSGAVKTSTGYDIIKVTDHKAASTPTMEEKREDIKSAITTQKLASLSTTWLQDKKSQSTVENYLSKPAGA
ncbi:peptidylprolyl isomerase [Paenibacillus sp. CGMCC 1.16610]|uniref:peptidylprolyl isomerase n=1 Tax=Paenibacillus anseongense TaxID=2682845 RepID=A0ABW9UH66_9BACL|nr:MULTISPECIES: peptidyl-prolyl cis-trans isomerase [Paenibacillus]MBA2942861.1 peptidylprolyl isomerase [Paenibacillus sp. CGMCC 1.16610]MVQ38346.1 peptidylprolyl isomerase [Paenibacillus anseongense]